MRRIIVVLSLCVTACARADVHTEQAVEAPTSTDPPDTTAPPEAPDTTELPETTQAPATTVDPDAPSTSSGDSLLPELGSADLDVQTYDVRLSYDPETEELAGTVDITAAVVREVAEIALDATDLTVEAVAVDGEPATFDHVSPELVVRPATPVGPGTPVVVSVTYRDDRHASSVGFDLGGGFYPTAKGAHTLNEPDGARTWLPSNDHPSDKATWHFELSVPAGFTAVANGHVVEQRQETDGTTWVWAEDEAMATYAVQVLIGPYAVLDGGAADDVPLTNVAFTDDVSRMQPYFDQTAAQIEFFEPFFGPYPLDRYGLAFVDSVPGLAMEHQGRSLFSRDDFPGGTPDPIAQLLLSHELAHQWFGNAVTPADWSDLWLNESFASYAQWMWLDHIELTSVEQEARRNLDQRQTPTEPTGEPSLDNLFGYERYDGGAVVVHALRREIGDDAFFTLLQRWVAENNGTSRTSADFIALAEEVAGESLTEFFDAWLYSPSVPAEYPG